MEDGIGWGEREREIVEALKSAIYIFDGTRISSMCAFFRLHLSDAAAFIIQK